MSNQENIRANGDVAGGDITKFQNFFVEKPQTKLSALIEQLKEDIEKDPSTVEFVENLLEWMIPRSGEVSRDLEKKLSDCNRGYLISEALAGKERFAKLLMRNTFRAAVQEVFAFVLGEIHAEFNLRIKPHIASETTQGAIEARVADLAQNITDQIAKAPPALGLGKPEIVGMLYYLTGNCHIDWDYNASLPPSN